MTTWTKCSFRCLKFNAPGTFFVSWFLATPNISQVVYLAIAADSSGFNPQNMVSKKQDIWCWKSKKCGLKKQEIRFEKANTNLTFLLVVGFTLLPPRRWTMINAVPVQRLPSFPRPLFVNLLILSKLFVNLMIKHCARFPAWVQGVGIELIPRIIVLITEFGGI